MLGRRNLIVLRLRKDPQLPQLRVQILHKLKDPGLDRTEVMIIQLLSLGRHRTEQSSSGVDQIRPFQKHLPIDQKVFLLRSD